MKIDLVPAMRPRRCEKPRQKHAQTEYVARFHIRTDTGHSRFPPPYVSTISLAEKMLNIGRNRPLNPLNMRQSGFVSDCPRFVVRQHNSGPALHRDCFASSLSLSASFVLLEYDVVNHHHHQMQP